MSAKLDVVRSEESMDKTTREEIEVASGNIAKAISELEEEIKKQEVISEPAKVLDPELTNNELQQLEESRRRMQSQHYQLRMGYNDPVPNFDRSKVKGKLFTLFRVKDRQHEKAIEIGAGGKLYNIVVENETISKLLIERETFGKSVSIVPNNKIRYK
jgi:structural maintenance of chromosome 2